MYYLGAFSAHWPVGGIGTNFLFEAFAAVNGVLCVDYAGYAANAAAFVCLFCPAYGGNYADIAAALLAFVLNYAAYFAEIFRAGIQAIGRGQYEAAKTLGMTYPQTMRRIIIPQMIRHVLPPISNETINLVKDTSLIYILAMNDLLRVARTIVQREFDMTPFVIAGVFYLVMTFVLTWAFKKLEAHYAKYDQ